MGELERPIFAACAIELEPWTRNRIELQRGESARPASVTERTDVSEDAKLDGDLHDRIRELETASLKGFPTVWEQISQTVNGPTQVDEIRQVCSGFRG